MIRIVNTMKITVLDPERQEWIKDVSAICVARAMAHAEKICHEEGVDCLVSQTGPTDDPSIAGVPDEAFYDVLRGGVA